MSILNNIGDLPKPTSPSGLERDLKILRLENELLASNKLIRILLRKAGKSVSLTTEELREDLSEYAVSYGPDGHNRTLVELVKGTKLEVLG